MKTLVRCKVCRNNFENWLTNKKSSGQKHFLNRDFLYKNLMEIGKYYIDSAWYFNGSVYGKTSDGKRSRFDLYTDIDDVVNGWKKVKPGSSAGTTAEPMDSAEPH